MKVVGGNLGLTVPGYEKYNLGLTCEKVVYEKRVLENEKRQRF